MRYKSIVVLLFLIPQSISAQVGNTDSAYQPDVEFGVNASLGVRHERMNGITDFQPVMESGLFVTVSSGEWLRFGSELNFTLTGFNAEKLVFKNSPPPYFEHTYIDRLYMLNMPLGLYGNIGESSRLGLGYSFNYITGYRKNVEEWNNPPIDPVEFSFRSLDLALFTEFRYSVTPNIVLRLKYRYGLLSIVDSVDERYNRWVSFGMMYLLKSAGS